MPVKCPAPRSLRSYLRGESSATNSDLIELHLATCLDCQTLVETIAEETDSRMVEWAQNYVGQLQGTESPATERASRNGRTGQTMPMQTIRDYQIMERIGQGGMGAVYLALHQRLNRLVALKIIKSDSLESIEANSRFAREMRLVAQLEHPQIVRALDAGEHEGQQYFVMELIAGVDLGQFVRRLGPLPVPEVCQIICLAANALQYAHQNNIIHRDVKPSNFMVTSDGNVKLLDLGLAQIFDLNTDSSVTTADQAVGTYAYMAPELLYGATHASPRSDIFSLGVTFFQLLSGMRPFERPGSPVLLPSLCATRPDVPPELNASIYQMMAHSPEARPASMAAVESQVSAYVDQANLSSLVAEYYRWNNRQAPLVQSRPIQAPPILTPSRSDSYGNGSSTGPRSFADAPHRRQRAVLMGKFFGFMAIMLTLLSLVAVLVNWPEPPPVPRPPDIPMGIVDLKPHGELTALLIKERSVTAVCGDNSYVLKPGENSLPPRNYRIEFDAPVAFEQEGAEFEVTDGSRRPLTIEANLTRPFQYPTLPDENSHGFYHGHINQNPTDSDADTAFEISFKVLKDHAGNKWLVVSAKHQSDPDNLMETAYLQFDEQRWQDEPTHLPVRKGYIESSSRTISEYLGQHAQFYGRKSLIFAFDPDVDWLAESKIATLPKNRISMHDFLTMFFGVTNLNAASTSVRKMRSLLAAESKRFAWLEDVNNGTGQVSCYVTSSRPQGTSSTEFGYFLARRDAELFGFVQLEVNLPHLSARCVLANSSVLNPTNVEEDLNRLAQIAKEEMDPGFLPEAKDPVEPTPPPEPTPSPEPDLKYWHLAKPPSEPSWVRWEGSITRGGRTELLNVRVSMFAKYEELNEQWLELEVTSDDNGRQHTEFARLAIDADMYENSREFKILANKGWIAFDDRENVFEFPSDGNIDSLADKRLRLQSETSFNQIGVIDILALAFGAKLRPTSEIGKLRTWITAELAGQERKPTAETRPNTKSGPRTGHVWKLDAPVTYEFFVCPEMPFGFVSVTLNVPQMAEIKLEAVSDGPIKPDSESIFGNGDQLDKAVALNLRRLIPKPTEENWRTWSWAESGTAYKVYGEFGGTFELAGANGPTHYVVIVNRDGRFIRVPLAWLSREDKESIKQGRQWATIPSQRTVLIEDNERTGQVLYTFALGSGTK
jgi:serine/threonine protein kinase